MGWAHRPDPRHAVVLPASRLPLPVPEVEGRHVKFPKLGNSSLAEGCPEAQRQCQEERRELTERVIDTVTEVKAVVRQNSVVVAENTDATRELAEKIEGSQ